MDLTRKKEEYFIIRLKYSEIISSLNQLFFDFNTLQKRANLSGMALSMISILNLKKTNNWSTKSKQQINLKQIRSG